MPYRKQNTPCRDTHRQSGTLKLPWDQITNKFAVSMAATPVAQRRMGFKPLELKTVKGPFVALVS